MDLVALELFFVGLLGLASLAIVFVSAVVVKNLYRGDEDDRERRQTEQAHEEQFERDEIHETESNRERGRPDRSRD